MECDDIDECTEDAQICGDATAGFCFNSVGAYACECNDGFYFFNETCSDIDECDVDLQLCSDEGEECLNSYGSYSCGCAEGPCPKFSRKCFAIYT